jgi:phytoene desaturase
VAKIEVNDGRATGVLLDSGERLAADIVVSNVDPHHLYGRMVEPGQLRLPTSLKLRSTLTMGLFMLYFGTRRTYPDVAHNTIWLGRRYKELLADVFDRKVLADDFSLYIHRPTATDPSFAPAGSDSFYALCPVPNNSSGINWLSAAPALRDRIVAALDRTILPGLRDMITSELVMTPDDFEARYLSQYGNGFSVAPYFLQSAWFRFHNRSESIRNLYLVGAGTHPGAGIPGVLCSAQIVSDMVRESAPVP